MRKRDELSDPGSCLNKAADDEPIFVIRAKDPLGAATVLQWAQAAERHNTHEPERISQARMLANTMMNWRAAKGLDG